MYISLKRENVHDTTITPHNNQLKGLHESLVSVLSICLFIEQISLTSHQRDVCRLKPPHRQTVIMYC